MNLAAVLLSRLFRRHADTGAVPPAAHDDGERPQGCGWFDSSHELRRGLDVVECAVLDAEPATA